MNEQYQQIIDEAYENYSKAYEKDNSVGLTMLVKIVDGRSVYRKPSKDMFVAMCTYDKSFSEKWRLKIEERSISLAERRSMVTQEMFNQIYNGGGPETLSHSEIDQWNIPTKLITVAYKGKKTEVYE